MAGTELVTAQALAEALGLSVETIWRYTREQRIPVVELGPRNYRYNLDIVMSSLSHSVQERKAGYGENTLPDLTYADYLKLPEEPGVRVEVLDGTLVKEPAPGVPHQRASGRLQHILQRYVWDQDPDGEVFSAPLDVTLGDNNVVQPDLLYISSTQKEIAQHTRINGAPLLIVEILSPSTGRKDRLQKMRIYQKSGVMHYWLLNPEDKTLECFALQSGLYALVVSGMDNEKVNHPSFSGLVIDLGFLW